MTHKHTLSLMHTLMQGVCVAQEVLEDEQQKEWQSSKHTQQ